MQGVCFVVESWEAQTSEPSNTKTEKMNTFFSNKQISDNELEAKIQQLQMTSDADMSNNMVTSDAVTSSPPLSS